MIQIQNVNFIPIGCSCINQFQLNFNFGNNANAIKKGSLFDWNITSPQSTVEILKAVVENKLYQSIGDRNNYILENGYLRNVAFESFYFWHEDGKKVLSTKTEFESFKFKVWHLIDNFLQTTQSENNLLIWSNIQPNLQDAIAHLSFDWDIYRLTKTHYDEILELSSNIFRKGRDCVFISRKEDVEISDSLFENVIVLELDRGGDYQGSIDLYSPIFKKFFEKHRASNKAKRLIVKRNENMGKNEPNALRRPFQACPLCKREDFTAIVHANVKNHLLYNDSLPSDLTWLQCSDCNHVFTQHYWTEEGLKLLFANAHVNQISGGNPDQKRQTWKPVVHNVLNMLRGGYAALSTISPTPVWIDVGCGDGGLVMTAAEFGFHAVGLDARTQTVQALRDVGYQAVCGDFMRGKIDGHPLIISMMDVLEHLPNPCEALQHAHSLLHEKGVLVISLPNSDCSSWRLMGNANPYWIEIEHYHNFSRQRLTALLNQYGFDVVHYDIPFRYKAQMELYAVKNYSQQRNQNYLE